MSISDVQNSYTHAVTVLICQLPAIWAPVLPAIWAPEFFNSMKKMHLFCQERNI